MQIREAKLEDIESLANLFNEYIIFYRKPSNLESCRNFLTERLIHKEAIVFLALEEDGRAAGFTLLYPGFSSVSRSHLYILNDLYVHPHFRRLGVGANLLKKAVDYGKSKGAIRLHLETEQSNVQAQKLYEKEGWEKERDVFHYNYTL